MCPNSSIVENNVTANWIWGVELDSCGQFGLGENVVARNNVTANGEGSMLLLQSYNNSITDNNIAKNGNGIVLIYSSDNILLRNNIMNNNAYGIDLDNSCNNSISRNNIVGNEKGIGLLHCSSNRFFHNNLIDNGQQVYCWVEWDGSINVWDDGHPSGGNYWSDYNGTDANHDAVGDTAYIIDADNTDHYPLMNVIPEFPSFFILRLFFTATLLIVVVYRRKHVQRERSIDLVVPYHHLGWGSTFHKD